MNTCGDISGTTSSNNVIDEPLRFTLLPPTHPISALEELREYSMSDNHRRFSAASRITAGAEKGVVLAHNGKKPSDHTGLESSQRANLVAREWANGEICWTIDLNGNRHVVQTRLGGNAGGANYRIWQGKDTKFDGPPVAFGVSQAEQPDSEEHLDSGRRTSGRSGKNRLSDKPADRRGGKSPDANRYSFRNHANHRNSSDSSESETEIAPSKYRLDLFGRTNQRSGFERTNNGKRAWTDGYYWQPADKSNIMGGIESNREGFNQSRPNKTRRTPAISSSSDRDQTRKREEETVSSRHALSSGSRIYESLPDRSAVAELTKETTMQGPRILPSAQTASTTNSAPETEQSTISGSGYSLSPYKLNNTILCISVAGRLGKENIKLHEISTLDRFFDAVLEFSDAVGQEDKINLVLITCSWLDDGESMSIRRNYPSTFDFFLEAVDKSPWWEHEGKCEVEVAVTRK